MMNDRSPLPPVETIERVADEVLSRPEFITDLSEKSWWVQFLDWLKQWQRSMEGWQSEHPILGWLVLIALLIVALGLLAHIFYVGGKALWSSMQSEGIGERRQPNLGILEGKAGNWREGMQVGRRSLEEGDLREALWMAHRVMLGMLDEKGWLVFSGGKTNSDYLKECREDDELYPMFKRLTALYERVVYAQLPGSGDEIRSVFNWIEGWMTQDGGRA